MHTKCRDDKKLSPKLQAQKKFDECEKLREEREQLRNLARPGFLKDNDYIMQQQQKAMEVCPIDNL